MYTGALLGEYYLKYYLYMYVPYPDTVAPNHEVLIVSTKDKPAFGRTSITKPLVIFFLRHTFAFELYMYLGSTRDHPICNHCKPAPPRQSRPGFAETAPLPMAGPTFTVTSRPRGPHATYSPDFSATILIFKYIFHT